MKAIFLALVWMMSFAALGANYTTPTKRSYDYPQFTDDMDFEWMQTALDRQLKAFDRMNMRGTIKLGTVQYPLMRMKESIELFQVIMQKYKVCINKDIRSNCVKSLNESIQNNFNLYVPDTEKKALFTAYYSPSLEASTVKTDEYKYGIYLKPSGTLNSKTRNQILFEGALDNSGLDLFYVKDPFELYLLHIEGGGQAEVVNEKGDRRTSFLSYSGSNGQRFSFISRYMINQGMIDSPAIDAQREYLKNHPEDWKEIYGQCPSFIWFKETTHPPVGVNNIPLTDFRSIAQDRKLYARKGLLSFVKSKKPYRDRDGRVRFKSFSRFMIDQDTGGAIRGAARADLYFGVGLNGELAANNLKDTKGEITFLIKK